MSKSFYAKIQEMDDSGQMDPLERILRKEPDARTPEDISMIEGRVESNEFLLKFKNTPKLRDLCRSMRVGSFQADEVIITEGEVGDKFYILYTGEVSISKGQKQQLLKGKIVQVSLTNGFFGGASCRESTWKRGDIGSFVLRNSSLNSVTPLTLDRSLSTLSPVSSWFFESHELTLPDICLLTIPFVTPVRNTCAICTRVIRLGRWP